MGVIGVGDAVAERLIVNCSLCKSAGTLRTNVSGEYGPRI